VRVFKNPNSTYSVVALKDGNKVANPGQVPPDKLEGTIGKGLAEKVLSSQKESFQFKGVDLEIGGEGLARIYDEMLPRKANEIGKRMGMRVGSTNIDTTGIAETVYELGKKKVVSVPSISLTPTAKQELLKPQNWLSIGPLGLTAILANEVAKHQKRTNGGKQ
jgi:hypothetical protein